MCSPVPIIPPPRAGHLFVFFGLAGSLLAMATSPSYQFSVNPVLAFCPLLALFLAQVGFALAYPSWAMLGYGVGRALSLGVYSTLFYHVVQVERSGADWVLLRPYLSIRRIWSDAALWAAAQEWNLAHPYYVPLPPQAMADAIASANHSLATFRQIYPELVRQGQPPPSPTLPVGSAAGGWLGWISGHPYALAGGSLVLLLAGAGGLFAYQKGWLNFADATAKFAKSSTTAAQETLSTVDSQAKAVATLGELSKTVVNQINALPPSVASTGQLLEVYRSLAEFSLASAREILLLSANQSLLFSLLQELPVSDPSYQIGDAVPPAPPNSIRGQTEFLQEMSRGLALLIRDLHLRLNIPLPRGLSDLD